MCGIAGKVSTRGAVDRALIESMCSTIEHRGPDSRGAFLDDGVGLGIQRLAVIDLGTGDQPIFSEDGNVVVVQNGEIYNYRELRDELAAARPHGSAPEATRRSIVHLYEEYGDACVDHLRGHVRLRALGSATDGGCCSRVTDSARSRSSTRRRRGRSGSAPRRRRSSATPRSRATSTTARSTATCTTSTSRDPMLRLRGAAQAAPGPRAHVGGRRAPGCAGTGTSRYAPKLDASPSPSAGADPRRARRGDAAAPS